MDAHNLVNFYKQYFDSPPKVILDFGAHDLRDSLILAEAFPDAKIYAFEANPEYFERCVYNNRFPERITITHKAISNVNGTINFYLTPGNIGASSVLKPMDWVPWTSDKTVNEIVVEATRLDSWLTQNGIEEVDLVWMDAQGSELFCLQGMGSYLSKVKMLQTEVGVQAYYEGHTLYPEVNAYLIDHGFEQIYTQHDWSHEDNLVYVNKQV